MLTGFFFFQALKFLVESFGLLNDLFRLPSILDAGYPVFYLHLADILCDVILPFVLGSCDLLVLSTNRKNDHVAFCLAMTSFGEK